MDFNQTQINKCQELLALNKGRATIMAAFNLSEWQARKLIDLSRNSMLEPTIYHSLPEHSQKRTDGKPIIKRKSSILHEGYQEVDKDANISISKRPIDYSVAVLSDIHVPYQDHQAVSLALNYLKDNKPDEIVLLGDICDFYSISRYTKGAGKPSLKKEIEACVEFLENLVDMFSGITIRFVSGNHEERVEKYLANNAAELLSLDSLKINKLLELDRLGIDHIPYQEELTIGDMTLIHGTRARKGAGSSIKGHFEEIAGSCIQGHVHRLALVHKRDKQGVHCLVENGTLANLTVDYTRFPDWQQGFTVIYFKGQQPFPVLFPIINGRLFSPSGIIYEVN